jgi:hypothetical protein
MLWRGSSLGDPDLHFFTLMNTLQRRLGYALGGDKVHTQLSGKRYERKSCMAIGNYQHKLVEPMIYQGIANANTVYAYFETVLPIPKQG